MSSARKPIAAVTAVALLVLAGVLVLGRADTGRGGPVEAPRSGSAPPAAGTIPLLGGIQCPARYEVAKDRSHSRAELRAARDGIFEVDGARTRLRAPVDWGLNTGRSRSFRHQLHKMKWSDVLLGAHAADGDRAALRQARDLFADWIEANPIRRPGTPAAAWADKRTGDRAPYMAYLLLAGTCEGIIDRPLQRDLIRSLRVHVAELIDPGKYKPTNHGLFQDLGLALLANQLSFDPGAERWRGLAIRRFERTLLRRLDRLEGFWLEHSSSYQVLVAKLVRRFVAVQGIDAPGLERIAERMEEVTAWLTMPDGRLVQFGDSDRDSAPAFAEPLLDGADGMLALYRAGLAVVRGEDHYLALIASFHNSTHKHSDELSFDLYDRGTRIVADTGLYHKDLDDNYEFAASAAAHSSLVIDEVEPPRDEGSAYGSGLLASGEGSGWSAILARNPLTEELGVRHRRLLLYRPSESLLVIDSLRSGQPHTYTRRFQLGEEVGAERTGASLTLAAPGLEGELVASGPDGRPIPARTRFGASDPRAGFLSPEFRRWLPRVEASYSALATDADLTAVFSLDGPARRLDVAEVAPDRWSLRLGDRSIVVSREGRRLRVRS